LSAVIKDPRHKWNILKRLSAKTFYRLLGSINPRVQPEKMYCIKAGYHHASQVEQFDDTGNKDEWQREVYQLAAELMRQHAYRSVIDVGCGSAYKLLKYLEQYDTIGVEISPTYEWLLNKYPERRWMKFDELADLHISTDLIICSDVIEHVENPDNFLQFLSGINCSRFIISTPERDGIAGRNDYGPPENVSHYREWNAEEFLLYLQQWFDVIEQKIFHSQTVTQVVICQKKKSL
jgi:SAM-dependent methyltransferase